MSWGMHAERVKSIDELVDAAVRGELNEAQTLRLCAECPELVTLALLAAEKRIAELQQASHVHQPASLRGIGVHAVYRHTPETIHL